MTKQDIQSTNAKNVNSKSSKKTWLILGIILGILLIPLVILDIRYRIEFAEFEAEQKLIASFLPNKTTEGSTRPDTRDGNGLLARLDCYISGLGKPCPIITEDYFLSIDHNEMEVARTALTKAGYEIESGDLPGTPGGECSIPEKDSCFAEGNKGKYSGWFNISQNHQHPNEPISYILIVEPNHLYKK